MKLDLGDSWQVDSHNNLPQGHDEHEICSGAIKHGGILPFDAQQSY